MIFYERKKISKHDLSLRTLDALTLAYQLLLKKTHRYISVVDIDYAETSPDT